MESIYEAGACKEGTYSKWVITYATPSKEPKPVEQIEDADIKGANIEDANVLYEIYRLQIEQANAKCRCSKFLYPPSFS